MSIPATTANPASTALSSEATPSKQDTSPIIEPGLSLLTRLSYGARLWTFKTFVASALATVRVMKSAHFANIAPTYTKRYPIRPMLECRIFLPKNYSPDSNQKYPLYIDIHGGGFALCDPQTDDDFCHHMSQTHGYCVASIQYRLAPSYPFPVPVEDCAEMARAVLADQDLPVDHTRVALGGFSAGGNLTLAIAQLPGVREKVKALVPVYPVVDFSGLYKGAYRDKPGQPDMLKATSALFNWGYVCTGQDRRDPLLSPVFAGREKLNMPIYFVGAQDDYLCHEAYVMAEDLAGLKGKGLGEDTPWEENGIRWEMVRDQAHGFTHVEMKGDAEIKRKEVCEKLYGRIDEWLKNVM